MPTDQEISEAVEYHRMHHVKLFTLPHDSPETDQERFEKEIRAAYPINGIIMLNFISADPVNGGPLYPEGRKLEPGETWTESP